MKIAGRVNVGVLFCASLLFAVDAPAGEGWLHWDAPPECPGVQHIDQRLHGWLGEGFPPPEPLLVEAYVRWRDDAWHVESRIRYGQMDGTRGVIVASCSEAADFVALNTALAVAPNTMGKMGAQELAPQIADDAAPDDAAPDDAAPDDATQDEQDPTTAHEGLTKESPQAGSAEQGRGWLALGVVGTGGALPSFRFGPSLGGGYQMGRLRAGLSVVWLPPRSDDVVTIATPVRSSLLTAELGICYLLPLPLSGAGIGPCLGGQLGGMFASQQAGAGSSRQDQVVWGAVSAGGEFDWTFGRHGGVFVAADVLIPISAPHFETTSGETVFSSRTGFSAQLGPSWLF